jgi:serine/threonine protein kinase
MSDLIGKNIANYQVIELIDESGRALVYRGFQASTNRYVAIKVLKSQLTQDPSVVQAYEQYAQRAAAMQNPHILPVLDAGQEDGSHYLITPFYENRSVGNHLSQYKDAHQALKLIQGIIQGLDFIYSQGTVHANLKPTNIILDDQQQPLLADFGLVSPGPETPFTSPEQRQGGAVDQRTDVFALGIILYVLLTGQVPPAGTSINLRGLRPDLAQHVEQTILKALAPNPDQRFQTPGQFGQAFANALQPAAPQPVAPTPAPAPPSAAAPPPPQQKSGMNWTNFILGGVVVVLMILCAIVVIPRVMDTLGGQSGEVATEPTEIPKVEIIIPTVEPPSLPESPAEDAPVVDPLPEDGAEAPQICSSLGFAGGFIFLGSVFGVRRRRKP